MSKLQISQRYPSGSTTIKQTIGCFGLGFGIILKPSAPLLCNLFLLEISMKRWVSTVTMQTNLLIETQKWYQKLLQFQHNPKALNMRSADWVYGVGQTSYRLDDWITDIATISLIKDNNQTNAWVFCADLVTFVLPLYWCYLITTVLMLSYEMI